jgi:ABC-2 type transport system permease protein
LGFLWSLLNPLAMIVVYSIAFKYILRIQIENFTLFIITGILPWNFFGSAINASTDAVIGNAGLVKKIFFPREILPLATVLFTLAQFLLALLVFFPALIVLRAPLTWPIVAYPLVLMIHLVFTLGAAFLLSAITVFYPDVKHLTEVALMILFWVTPVVYHLSMVPTEVQTLFRINPLTTYITAYQDIVYWGRWPALQTWTLGGLWACAMLASGWWVFRRFKRSFAEEL